MVELYAFNITSKKAGDKFEYYLNFLDNVKREQIQNYRFQEDKLRSLYGNVIMRSLVSERLKMIIYLCGRMWGNIIIKVSVISPVIVLRYALVERQ